MLRSTLIVLLSFVVSVALFAQETMPKTNTTDIHAKVNKKRERPEKKRRYLTIIKSNTRGILYGNKCFEDYTLSKGYLYDVQIKGKQGSMNGFARFWHNFGVNVALVFTKGPWWKLNANSKMKECRKLSGDFVG
jgi:hypothetical protein